MTRLVLNRVVWMLPILLGVSVLAFLLMLALPGDFVVAVAGTTELSDEALATIRRNLGLDQPVWLQYWQWLTRLLAGDFGSSFVTHKLVLAELLPRLAVTAELTLIAGLMGLLIGAASGLASARLRGRVDWLVFGNPGHPYTRSLLNAVPVPQPALQRARLMQAPVDADFRAVPSDSGPACLASSSGPECRIGTGWRQDTAYPADTGRP